MIPRIAQLVWVLLLLLLLLLVPRRRAAALALSTPTTTSVTLWNAIPRAGGDTTSSSFSLPDDSDDAALDAYIDELIASVDDSHDATTTAVSDIEVAEENAEQADEPTLQLDVTDESADDENVSSEAVNEEETAALLTTAVAGDIVEDHDPKILAPGSDDELQSAMRANDEGTTVPTDKNANGNYKPSKIPSPSGVTAPAMTISSQRPNALYRFLLRQGYHGHVLTVLLTVLVEWCRVYVPWLTQALTSVGTAWWPAAASSKNDNNDDLADQRRSRPSLSSLSSAGMVDRSGQSRRRRRQWARQADQQALHQLQQAASTTATTTNAAAAIKYRLVSAAFLQRHGLGPYAGAPLRRHHHHHHRPADDDAVIATATDATRMSTRPARQRKTKSSQTSVTSNSDDWVLQALQKPLPDNHGATNLPSLSLGMDTSGALSLGLEFQIGNSATSQHVSRRYNGGGGRRRRRRQPPTELPSHDADTSFLSRMRTASNSQFSRSLLGAYPRDAVPLEEAASARGVVELAARYGYGHWSDGDDDNDEMFGTVDIIDGDRDDKELGLLYKPSDRSIKRRKRTRVSVEAARNANANKASSSATSGCVN